MDPGILAAIGAVHHAVRATLGTVDAVYSRGDDSVEIELTLTQAAAWFATPEAGVSTRINQTQFLARPEDLDFGAGPQEPAPGDLVTFETGDWSYQFEVRPPQDDEPCFAWADPYAVTMRLHAKLLSRTAAASSSSSTIP